MHGFDRKVLMAFAGAVCIIGFFLIFIVAPKMPTKSEVVVDPVTDRIAKQFDPIERSCERHCLEDRMTFYGTPDYLACAKKCADKGGMADQISVDACEVALSALDLYIDRETNPPGPKHDLQKDHEGILRLRKLCQTSSNRLALVRHYLTDERLPFLMEAHAEAARGCIEMAKVCVEYLPQAVQPKQE